MAKTSGSRRLIIKQRGRTPQGIAAEPANNKPLAAYILGCNSFLVRFWQQLFWIMPETEWQTWDAVPLALDQLDQSLVGLADEVNAGVLIKIREPMGKLRGLSAAMVNALEDPETEQQFSFGSRVVPGEGEWKDLVSLADRALDDHSVLKPWYLFGREVGRYQLDLSLEYTSDVPDIQPLLNQAVALPPEVVSTIPELQRLARYASNRQRLGPVAIMGRVVGTERGEAVFDASFSQYVLGNRLMRLDARTRDALRLIDFGVPLPESTDARHAIADTPAIPASSRRLFVPNDFQKRILAALEGNALTKKELALEVCGGEGTRLYRRGGIKELREKGLVDHKDGVGYFRPDAPPEGSVLLDAN